MHLLVSFLAVAGTVALGILVGAGVLHLIPKLGEAGRRLSDRLCAGFPLDCVVTYFTALPLILGPVVAGWAGLIGAVIGQLLGLILWELLHELTHLKTAGRLTIFRTISNITSPSRNLIAVFWTAWAVPVFWVIRVAEYFVYAPLPWLVRFPKYDHREWVNVTRHKFEGLVGHDRIWCLYCDWMTGVWSLGTEMLRNVESFWCPIRFGDASKCANCTIDFPDIDGGWVRSDGTMGEVAGVLKEQYGEPNGDRPNAWFGHPAKAVPLTVKGQTVERETVA